MTVNLTISDTSMGNSLADTEDMGTLSPSSSGDYQDMYISHDAENNAISDVSLYATRCTRSFYLGDDADADITELLGWGDAATGGISFVMDGWDTWTSGENTTGSWLTVKNGYGDVDNQIPLVLESITLGTPPSSDGEIPVSGEAHLQIKVTVPSSVPRGAGYRAFEFVVAYSATS
jgi:hypothetical protein